MDAEKKLAYSRGLRREERTYLAKAEDRAVDELGNGTREGEGKTNDASPETAYVLCVVLFEELD